MAKKMLIDATHQEEIRLSIVAGNKLEEFDFETTSKQQIKGNVYLAQVTRVEPSLQAAFVEYGGNRQGFLPFNEIHPDYYQIPVADRVIEDQSVDYDDGDEDDTQNTDAYTEEPEIENFGNDTEEVVAQSHKKRPRLKRHYKIQEVIKNRQIILVQVVKEQRGNKGASMTTYLSLAGRYCVLMPNSSRGGGVSRKITNGQDRKRLKDILKQVGEDRPGGVIVRTAGAGRTKLEIKRDYKYIYGLWDKIRDKTLKSIAPETIYEESGLINRAIRDMYSNEIEEIIVAGETGYKTAKEYMKDLTPSHAKKVKKYKSEGGIPLFQRYQVESQISHIYDSQVYLPSGGSIVLHQTEALVAIDVNSGRSIGERNVDATAIKTNLEAAEEVARQLRLRDMAGLIVIDFIDMEDRKSNILVERRLKESLRMDRARIQVGRISQFGLLEMSRQRLRPSLIDASSSSCPSCGGSGIIPNLEISAMATLRSIEEEIFRQRSTEIRVTVPTEVGFYLLNNKRARLSELEQNFDTHIYLQVSADFVAPKYEMIRVSTDGNEVIVGAASENNKSARRRKKNPQNEKWQQNDKGNRYNRRKSNKNTISEKSADTESLVMDTDMEKSPEQSNNEKTKGRRFRNRSRKNKDTQNIETVDMNMDGIDNTVPTVSEKSAKKPENTDKDNTQAPVEKSADTGEKSLQTTTSKTPAKKAAAKKTTAKKATVKKATAKKATVKKAATKKATAKKSSAKKATAKKSTAKKTTAKTTAAKKSVAKKATTKKAGTKKSDAKTTPITERTGWWA